MQTDLLLSREASKMLDISTSTLHRWAFQGYLPVTYTYSGIRLFGEKDILDLKGRITKTPNRKFRISARPMLNRKSGDSIMEAELSNETIETGK